VTVDGKGQEGTYNYFFTTTGGQLGAGHRAQEAAAPHPTRWRRPWDGRRTSSCKLPETVLALEVQLVILVIAFVMASTVLPVCSSTRVPRAQPFVKVGARASLPFPCSMVCAPLISVIIWYHHPAIVLVHTAPSTGGLQLSSKKISLRKTPSNFLTFGDFVLVGKIWIFFTCILLNLVSCRW